MASCHAAASPECVKATFDLATCLIFNGIDVATGMREWAALAEAGHHDAMVGMGIVLVEGISGARQDPATGLRWLRQAAADAAAPTAKPTPIPIAVTRVVEDEFIVAALRLACHRADLLRLLNRRPRTCLAERANVTQRGARAAGGRGAATPRARRGACMQDAWSML